jgi:hypothetical protein
MQQTVFTYIFYRTLLLSAAEIVITNTKEITMTTQAEKLKAMTDAELSAEIEKQIDEYESAAYDGQEQELTLHEAMDYYDDLREIAREAARRLGA